MGLSKFPRPGYDFTCTIHNQDTSVHGTHLQKGRDTVCCSRCNKFFNVIFSNELDKMAVWLHDINQGERRTEGLLSSELYWCCNCKAVSSVGSRVWPCDIQYSEEVCPI